MNLYPLKFNPILKSMIWGGTGICKFKNLESEASNIGESWEISGVDGNISVVSEGYLKDKTLEELIDIYKERLVGHDIYNKYGNTFPLLIKFIDARDNLSIQVHPNDELAKKDHNCFGKTEMWYVIDAADDAFLYSGFEKKMEYDEYEASIKNNTFVDYLAKHNIKKGDVFFLPSGRVHAIGAGTFIAEIQQTSNITYRIYDYDRIDTSGNKRDLHTQQAQSAIDFGIYDNYRTDYKKEKNNPAQLEKCEYFTTNLLDLDKPLKRDYTQTDSFVIYICMGGDCIIADNKNNKTEIRQGESILIPAETRWIEITPRKNVLLLETYV